MSFGKAKNPLDHSIFNKFDDAAFSRPKSGGGGGGGLGPNTNAGGGSSRAPQCNSGSGDTEEENTTSEQAPIQEEEEEAQGQLVDLSNLDFIDPENATIDGNIEVSVEVEYLTERTPLEITFTPEATFEGSSEAGVPVTSTVSDRVAQATVKLALHHGYYEKKEKSADDTVEYSVKAICSADDTEVVAVSTIKLPGKPLSIDCIEVIDQVFNLNSAIPVVDDKGTLVSILSTCFKHLDEWPDKELMILGHTDTSGEPQPNFDLSEKRAQSIKALLSNDAELWKGMAKAQSDVVDYQQIVKGLDILKGWGCDPGTVDGVDGSATQKGLKAFQSAYNENFDGSLAVDGNIGPNSWAALLDVIYQTALEQSEIKPSRIKPRFHAEYGVYPCGESFPVDQTGMDGLQSASNRRVEIHMSDRPNPPKLPEPIPEMAVADIVLYDSAVTAMNIIAIIRTTAGSNWLDITLHDDLDSPLAGYTVIIELPDGTQLEEVLDNKGSASVEITEHRTVSVTVKSDDDFEYDVVIEDDSDPESEQAEKKEPESLIKVERTGDKGENSVLRKIVTPPSLVLYNPITKSYTVIDPKETELWEKFSAEVTNVEEIHGKMREFREMIAKNEGDADALAKESLDFTTDLVKELYPEGGEKLEEMIVLIDHPSYENLMKNSTFIYARDTVLKKAGLEWIKEENALEDTKVGKKLKKALQFKGTSKKKKHSGAKYGLSKNIESMYAKDYEPDFEAQWPIKWKWDTEVESSSDAHEFKMTNEMTVCRFFAKAPAAPEIDWENMSVNLESQGEVGYTLASDTLKGELYVPSKTGFNLFAPIESVAEHAPVFTLSKKAKTSLDKNKTTGKILNGELCVRIATSFEGSVEAGVKACFSSKGSIGLSQENKDIINRQKKVLTDLVKLPHMWDEEPDALEKAKKKEPKGGKTRHLEMGEPVEIEVEAFAGIKAGGEIKTGVEWSKGKSETFVNIASYYAIAEGYLGVAVALRLKIFFRKGRVCFHFKAGAAFKIGGSVGCGYDVDLWQGYEIVKHITTCIDFRYLAEICPVLHQIYVRISTKMAVLREDYQEFKDKLIDGGTDLVADLGKLYAKVYDQGMREVDEFADKLDDYLDDTVEWINTSFKEVSTEFINAIDDYTDMLPEFPPEVTGNLMRVVDSFVKNEDKETKGDAFATLIESAADEGVSWVIRQFSDEKVPLNKNDSKRELAKSKAKESGESKLADIIDERQLKKIAKEILPKKGYTWLTELL
ncbi:MAG: hypothetical protein OCC49_10970 [Fibrobacterales bacterium]